MNFKPSLEAEEFIESIHGRVGARNKAVLGRSALFLALGEGVPDGFKSPNSAGKDLSDETVIGDELRDVVRAALNYRAGRALSEGDYRQSFRLHFEYGCHRLKQIWEDSGNDQVHFVNALLQIDGKAPASTRSASGSLGTSYAVSSQPLVESEVRLKLLSDADEWSINGPETKNGLLVISGEPGSGKSQLALDLLAQLASNGVRFLFFDLKGELEPADNDAQKAANRAKFFEQTNAQGVESYVIEAVHKAIDTMRELGAEIIEIDMPTVEYSLATYYIIAPCEASSNLARYDGVKYGLRVLAPGDDIAAMTSKTRAAGFGPEVQHRIMIGTHALSSGFYDAYYVKAQKVRTLIRRDFDAAFQKCDVLATPTAPSVAFKIGEKTDDAFAMKLADVCTIPVNMAGLPALSLPCGFHENLPIGLQLIGNLLDESTILRAAHAYEQATEWHKTRAAL